MKLSLIHHYSGSAFATLCVVAIAVAGCTSTAAKEEAGTSAEDITGGSNTNNASYDAVRGNRIADRALALWGNGYSRDLCLAGVGDTLDSSNAASPLFPRLASAVDFDNWSIANPNELAIRGFQRQVLDINHIPRGTIITWRPGQCGYSSQYGHIEIVSDAASSRACSDFCGSIRKDCGAPGMIVPLINCEVEADTKVHCANTANTPMHQSPWAASPVVNTLRSTNSWFECWFPGEMHAGGNTTWYWTMGDDNTAKGFVPAVALQTPPDFDANPSAHGLVKCGD